MRPVLKRADSVKQIGNAVLESPLTTYAADRIDGAFTAGDKFVDKYLVPISTDQDQTDGESLSLGLGLGWKYNLFFNSRSNDNFKRFLRGPPNAVGPV